MSTESRRSVAYSQNFLWNRRLIDRLLERSSIGSDDLVVEIGPGKGAITERLARRCHQVVAIEKDPRLARQLSERFAGVPNVAVYEGDFLRSPLPISGYKVFASIPFNVTTAIVGKLTSGQSPPADCYLVVQQEAAERFLGEPRETLVSVLLKPWFAPVVVHRFRRADFVPAPRVDSVLLRLERRAAPLVDPDQAGAFRDFVVAVFTAWQPTVRESLTRLLRREFVEQLEVTLALDIGRPPTSLRFEEWVELYGVLQARGDRQMWRQLEGAEERLRRQQAGLQKSHRTRVASS